MSEKYHVVCHECPFEGLYEAEAAAVGQRDAHEADRGHRLSLLEITAADPQLSQ